MTRQLLSRKANDGVLLAFFFALCMMAHASATRAQDVAMVSLRYDRVDADACPSSRALADQIEALTARPVFTPASKWIVRIRIERTAARDALVAHVHMLHDGRLLGERRLDSAPLDCDALSQAVVLAAANVIDLVFGPPTAQTHASEEPALPPAVVPAATITERSESLRLGLAAAPYLLVGFDSMLASGALLRGDITWRQLRVGIRAVGSLPASSSNTLGDVHVFTAGVGAQACYSQEHVWACAILDARLFNVRMPGLNFTQSKSAWQMVPALSVGFRWTVAPDVRIGPFLEVSVLLDRIGYSLFDTEVFRLPRALASLGVEISWDFARVSIP